MSSLLIDATGLAALALNVGGLVGRGDRRLRHSAGWAAALWAANNFLIGATNAAALNMLGAGRQASASAVQQRGESTRRLTCALFLALTLGVGALTWSGPISAFTTAGSALSTVAMFFLRGVRLRVAMVVVASLWMVNAWAYDSGWQLVANALNAAAAAWGAWRVGHPAPPATRD